MCKIMGDGLGKIRERKKESRIEREKKKGKEERKEGKS